MCSTGVLCRWCCGHIIWLLLQLLPLVAQVNARLPLWNAFNALLRDAHLDSPDWRHAADNVLKHKMTHGGWPWLYNDE
jgi:hypothetical protein